MGIGASLDAFVGTMSRLLHVRATNRDTSGELAPYYALDLPELLPPPSSAPEVQRIAPRFSLHATTETLSWRSAHEPLTAPYRRRHETHYDKNLTAFARWLHPKRGRRRSVLIYVHGWLEPGSWIEEATLLPLWFRTLNVDVAHVQLPFHGRRRPQGQFYDGEWFWTADLVRSLEAVRQAVIDVRSLMAHFRAIGYEEVGVTGLSLGGCIAMLTACLTPTPDYVVPMIAHLELADAVEEAPILWRVKDDLGRFGLAEPQRRELFSRIALGRATPVLDNARQLWIAAREDGYLKAELVRKQWDRWGRPPILWIPGGHMSFPIGMPAILRSMKAMPRAT